MDNAVHTNDTVEPSLAGFFNKGVLFGALVGFGTMMLFAPKSGKKTRTQIGLKSIELHNRATDTYDDLVTLSHFDNRKILTGTQILTETENKHAGKAIENLSNQVSPEPKTEMQNMIEEMLYNDSLGG
jgi:gas vesicle protein